MQEISSAQNSFFKKLISLKTNKGRDLSREFVIEGLQFVKDIAESCKVNAYAFSKEFAENNDLSQFEKRGPVYIMPEVLFKKASDTVNPQGVLAVCPQIEYNIDEILNKENCLIVVLEQLQDPGNLGAVIRTAAAAFAGGIILTEGSVSLYNPKVLRSAASSVFSIPVIENVNCEDTLNKLLQKEFNIIATDVNTEKNHYQIDFKRKTAVLIGNEANGLSESSKRLANEKVKIPMGSGVESLNAAVACGIMLYEAVRQKMY